jgi:alkanesulfonate monooxygenase SsuD/methylene tetrahydromethanopterin reductase-like flavin-dependent oxidoreductase (luciferase family)
MELGGFGVPREEKKAMWEEATRQVVKMMTSEPYEGYEGQYFTMPGRNVVPKPLQKPHPPLWVAASRRETVLVAARLGMGSLGFAFETPAEAAERVDSYYRLIREECRPIGVAINPAIAVLSSLMCLDSDDESVEKGLEGTQFFSYSLGHYYGPAGATHRPGREHIYRQFKDTPPEQRMMRGRTGRFGGQIGGFGGGGSEEQEPEDETQRALFRAARRGGMIGSPDYVRQNLLAYESSHLDAMIFVCQSGARKHEDIMRSLKLFGKEVLPEFKERHPEHQKWRQEQLKDVKFPISSSI